MVYGYANSMCSKIIKTYRIAYNFGLWSTSDVEFLPINTSAVKIALQAVRWQGGAGD